MSDERAEKWLRLQLAQAQERAEKAEHDAIGYKVVRDRYAQWAAEWEARYNQLRRLLQQAEWANSNWFCNPDDLKDMPEWANHPRCPWCDAPKATGRHAPDCELAAALSSSPESPYAALVEAARNIIEDLDGRAIPPKQEHVDALRDALSRLPRGGDDG